MTTAPIRFIDLTRDVLDASAVMIVGEDVWRRLRAIGVSRESGMLIVAMANPDDLAAIKEIEIRTGLAVFATRAEEADIIAAIGRSYER